jgi:hypothetical protein
MPGLRIPITGHQKNAPAMMRGGNGFFQVRLYEPEAR